jgi:hypothetical protein
MSDLTKLTADDLQSIADQFTHFAATYAQIAEELRDKKLGYIEVKGVPTMNYAIERITGSIGSAQKAIMNRRKIASGKPVTIVADPSEAYTIEKEALEANKRAASRKKKKG